LKYCDFTCNICKSGFNEPNFSAFTPSYILSIKRFSFVVAAAECFVLNVHPAITPAALT